MLTELASALRQSLGILQKQDIQPIARLLGNWIAHPQTQTAILLGDDCAAIPDGDGYLLLAAEGMWPVLVEAEPWFAGWCSVLVNVSDVYAMGGRPIAVVDALWSQSTEQAQPLWDGMIAAAEVLNVPIVGGHTNCHSPYPAISVAILGRATRLISSFRAQSGDALMLVTDFHGQAHPRYPFWDAATQADPVVLRRQLNLLPQLAEQQLCDAGKDISMGGILGTALMLLETSGCGAVLHLDQIPCPPALTLEKWLLCFPSYGFLLSVRPDCVEAVRTHFSHENLICTVIGEVNDQATLTLTWGAESLEFWNLQQPLTGFGKA